VGSACQPAGERESLVGRRRLEGLGERAGRRPGWAARAEKKRGKSWAGLKTEKGKVGGFVSLF
jgi:hypothetical protein